MNDKTSDTTTQSSTSASPVPSPLQTETTEPVFVPAPADDPGLTSPATPLENDEAVRTAENEAEELSETILVMLDSAELATRAASLAANAGTEMHQAAQKLIGSFGGQQKLTKIVLAALGGTVLLVTVVFVTMSYQLQGKVSQLDAMVLAVGKRIVSMDASLEIMNSASDHIKKIAEKQDAIISVQTRLETRLDEAVKSSQGMTEQAAKLTDVKSQDMVKLVQGLDGRLQSQASAVKSLSSQIQKLQGALPDSAGLRRELETLARQQKERPPQETAAKQAAPVKPREQMVQYPRVAAPGSATEKP